MADLSTFDNFFDKSRPQNQASTLKDAKYWQKAQHGAKKAQGSIKNAEIASKVGTESKYLFHTLLSLTAW